MEVASHEAESNLALKVIVTLQNSDLMIKPRPLAPTQ